MSQMTVTTINVLGGQKLEVLKNVAAHNLKSQSYLRNRPTPDLTLYAILFIKYQFYCSFRVTDFVPNCLEFPVS